MIELYIALALIALGSVWYLFRWAYKKGSNDLFQVFLKSGYETRVQGFKALNPLVTKRQIVIIGDSITQNYPTDELFKSHRVYNRGIGGDTTTGVLNRLEESCFALDPAHVFIWIGTNDFALFNRSPENISKNIEQIVSQIHSTLKGVKVSVISVCPVNAQVDSVSVGNRKNKQIQKLNQLISQIPKTVFVDVYKALVDDKGLLNTEYTFDGLHLNNEAYQIVTDIIDQSIHKK